MTESHAFVPHFDFSYETALVFILRMQYSLRLLSGV